MKALEAAQWMHHEVMTYGSLYQDDVVDYLVKNSVEDLLRENTAGNLVVGLQVLNEFMKLNAKTVVWVMSGSYWRIRVKEDGFGRNAPA